MVAREENFTRAAQILFVTQLALSKQLKLLEEELGKKLFVRKRNKIIFGLEKIPDFFADGRNFFGKNKNLLQIKKLPQKICESKIFL